MRSNILACTIVAMALCSGVTALAQDPPSENDRKPSEQQTTDAKKPPTPEHTGIHALFRDLGADYKNLGHLDNVYVAAIGGGLALAAHPVDQSFNAHLISHYDVVDTIYAPAKYLGDTPEQVALSVGTYAVGRIFDLPKASHLGLDLLRAQILTESLVEPLKFATNRERPDQSNRQSFPSGHAAITFAGATVLERHLGWKKSALAYVIAGYVASSRLHDNRHYLSDVVFGSAVGTLAGRTVTQHGAEYWTFVPVGMPGGGVAIYASHVGQEQRRPSGPHRHSSSSSL